MQTQPNYGFNAVAAGIDGAPFESAQAARRGKIVYATAIDGNSDILATSGGSPKRKTGWPDGLLSSDSRRTPKGGFVNSHPDPTGLRARRAWWPSSASCAFVAAGLEILSFGLSQYLVQRPTAPPGLTYMGFMI